MVDTVVLLGAGAEIEAGVPASTAMTQRIVDHIGNHVSRFDGIH